jgi:hypothetical protein
MRRSRAIKQLAVFLLVLILYIVWCVHPFFIGPSLRFSERVPPEAERVIRDFHEEMEMGTPKDLTAAGFIHALCHPYRMRVFHYVVSMESPKSCRINRRHHGAWFVDLENGKWKRSNRMIIY